MIRYGANFGVLTAGGEWWRVAAASFIHAGVLHLGINMLGLLVSCATMERLYGHLAFLFVWTASAAVAGLASIAAIPLSASVGASGAMMGIIGADIAFDVAYRDLLPRRYIVGQAKNILFFIALNGALYFLSLLTVSYRIDNAAHLGGLVTGFVVGIFLARREPGSSAAPGYAERRWPPAALGSRCCSSRWPGRLRPARSSSEGTSASRPEPTLTVSKRMSAERSMLVPSGKRSAPSGSIRPRAMPTMRWATPASGEATIGERSGPGRSRSGSTTKRPDAISP